MKNPFDKAEQASLTDKQETMLDVMFSTPEHVEALRKAFQLTSSDEKGITLQTSIQSMDFIVPEVKTAEEVLKDLDFFKKVIEHVSIVLNNIRQGRAGRVQKKIDKVDELKKEKEELVKELKELREERKDLQEKISEAKEDLNTTGLGKDY